MAYIDGFKGFKDFFYKSTYFLKISISTIYVCITISYSCGCMFCNQQPISYTTYPYPCPKSSKPNQGGY